MLIIRNLIRITVSVLNNIYSTWAKFICSVDYHYTMIQVYWRRMVHSKHSSSKYIYYPLLTPLQSKISLINGSIWFISGLNCISMNYPHSLTLFCQKLTCKTIWKTCLVARKEPIYSVQCSKKKRYLQYVIIVPNIQFSFIIF